MTPETVTIDRAWDFYEKLEIATKGFHRTCTRAYKLGPHELSSDINETLAELARSAGFDVEFTRSGITLTHQP